MKASPPTFLLEGLRLVSVCSVCPEEAKTEVHVLSADDRSGLVHVTCQVCGHSLMAHVERREGGVRCVGLVTDMSHADALELLQTPRIDTEDVLRIHERLTTGTFLSEVLATPRS